MKKIFYIVLIGMLHTTILWADTPWEKQGGSYYLRKDVRDNFGAKAAGLNKFTSKYLAYDGVDFLVRGANDWPDYGRINLDGNNVFSLPIKPGIKVDELHFLAGGNFGNNYKNDSLLSLYGDNYYYATINVTFVYQSGVYKTLSVPIFWDWFHLGGGEWSKDGAKIKSVGNNPVRKDCNLYHITILNPQPTAPLKDILVSDSWLGDMPFSDVFALTLKSNDALDAVARADKQFAAPAHSAVGEPADQKVSWVFDNGLNGWITGCSKNWDVDASWQANIFEKKGVVVLPACNWAGDKFSWIEKKITLPNWDRIELRFLRHSAVYSTLEKEWSDGLLKVIVQGVAGHETVYEKLYNGGWGAEVVDLSRFKGQTVIVRLENHGGGRVRLSQTTSAACDGEEAYISEIRLTQSQ